MLKPAFPQHQCYLTLLLSVNKSLTSMSSTNNLGGKFMLSEFQEAYRIGAYPFSDNPSYAQKHVPKLTVSQELLNEIILVSNLSLKEISTETCIPLRTLQRLKSGKTQNPKLEIFQKILELYCRVCSK
jgi:hypothetical protein